MDRSKKRLFITGTLGILTSIVVSLFLIQYSYNVKAGTFTEAGSLGSAIGGITAPIIGILTIVLLISTLYYQMQGNREQSEKNEIDFIFSLMAQLDADLNKFYRLTLINKGTEREATRIDYGHPGMVEYWTFIDNLEFRLVSFPLPKFSNRHEADKIMLIIDSFELVKERIDISSIKVKKVMYRKLNSFYKSHLQYPLEQLSDKIQQFEHYQDENSYRLRDFVQKYKNDSLLNEN